MQGLESELGIKILTSLPEVELEWVLPASAEFSQNLRIFARWVLRTAA
jgi:hypothetical protein